MFNAGPLEMVSQFIPRLIQIQQHPHAGDRLFHKPAREYIYNLPIRKTILQIAVKIFQASRISFHHFPKMAFFVVIPSSRKKRSRLLVILISLVVDDVEELELVNTAGGGDDTEPVTKLLLLEELLGPVYKR